MAGRDGADIAEAFRAEFPVLRSVSYLNAGTDGPVPRRGAEAAGARLRAELEGGRGGVGHFEGLDALKASLRARLGPLLGCAPDEVALTRSTTDGVNTVVSGLDLGPDDEVLTSDEEHPGLLAPLAAARRRGGFELRAVPFAEIAAEVGARTALVACSHVSWVSGRMVDVPALAHTGVPVLLDGAQGLGAVPVDVDALGCDYYAASGQKWLCGPDGSGCLYVRRARFDALAPSWPSYGSLSDPLLAEELPYRPDAARYDVGVVPGPTGAWSLAALELFEEHGWEWIHQRAGALAAHLADRLAERGIEVAPRGRSTLVSWFDPDPEATVERLASERIVVRQLPGRGLVRASTGAWTSEEEVERLVGLARR
ncbi:MAG: aminotransferase class V-fold PLP-dependent enzyme [Thermoleophilaceae bacterium]